MSDGQFTIKTTNVRAGGFVYRTYKLRGVLNGVRVRKQFKDRAEAEGEKARLEVQAANSGEIVPRNTRLTAEQLSVAEAAYSRLASAEKIGPRALAAAVDWYLAHYRPPVVEVAVETASAGFVADRTPHVSRLTLRDYTRTLRDLAAAYPHRPVHTFTSYDCEKFLTDQNLGKKRHNNVRGDLNAFFNYCLSPARRWVTENPIIAIPKFRIARGLPEIITTARAEELMRFVEEFRGGARSRLPAGCLVPYFALCLFAGIRPDVRAGEIRKLGAHPNLSQLVDLDTAVIRIPPEVAKTGDLRWIKIRPNLAAWLRRYPITAYPIILPNLQDMVTTVRSKFGLGDDVLRHTFISAHVAAFRSVGDAAIEAGNSEAMIKKHYLNMMTEAAAAQFWGIMPRAA
jgi:integrase